MNVYLLIKAARTTRLPEAFYSLLQEETLYRYYSGTGEIFAENISKEYVIEDRIKERESARLAKGSSRRASVEVVLSCILP